MRETLIRCDNCGASGAHNVAYRYDRYMDAAGSMDTDISTMDFCGKCMADLLSDICRMLSMTTTVIGANVSDLVRSKDKYLKAAK